MNTGSCPDLGLLHLIPESNKGLSASLNRSCTLRVYSYLTKHSTLSTLKKCVGYNKQYTIQYTSQWHVMKTATYFGILYNLISVRYTP